MSSRASQFKWVIGVAVVAFSVIILFLNFVASPQKISSKKRYIFVDAGAHRGETIAHFEKSSLYSQHPWEMFAFEANPNLIPDIPKKPNLTVLNKAVWTEDGTVEFYLGENTLSSSLLGDKKPGLSKTPIKIPSVDFGQWLKKNFSKDDVIFVKLDIEGAEYEVLDKMLQDESITYVDRLYVEFHNERVGVPEDRDRELVLAIQKKGVVIKIHSTEATQGDYFQE
jgi:FkbM family methyltransferase